MAGVLMCDGEILVQKDKCGKEYALPDGGVQIGETTETALSREFKEEIGAFIETKKLLWVKEIFGECIGKKIMALSFIIL